MRRLIGAMVAGLVGTGVTLVTPLTVSAALLWTLTATPLAVGTGVPTTFTLVASNLLLGRIECVVVDVPANFNVGGVDAVGSTAGDSWVAARDGNRVTVWTRSGGDRLELLDSVTFTVVATAISGGSLAWPATAYDRPECDGSGSLLGVPPIIVVSEPAVRPSPAPTPIPAPLPTLPPPPAPTPSPLPVIPLPLPLPTIGSPGIPDVSPRAEVTASPSPRPSAVPERSTTAEQPPGTGSPGPPPTSDGARGGEGRIFDAPAADPRSEAPRIGFDEPDLDLSTLSVGLLVGAPIWVVPVAAIGGPGLMVLVWVALQAAGASIWIPSARRLRGEAPGDHSGQSLVKRSPLPLRRTK